MASFSNNLRTVRDRIRSAEVVGWHGLWDLAERTTNSRPELVPPRRVNPNIGLHRSRSGYVDEFVESGDAIANMLVALGGLEPTDDVLDVGCGIGRVARALTAKIDGGTYQGFDAAPEAIAWCSEAYRDVTNFSFDHVAAEYIGIDGEIDAADVDFPCADASKDFSFSISLFTHLLSDATDRYLAETARVLRPGATAVNTFFVLDDDAWAAIRRGDATYRFPHEVEGCFINDDRIPRNAVGFARDDIVRRHDAAGLEVIEPIGHGSWSGRDNGYIYQDVVVARRRT